MQYPTIYRVKPEQVGGEDVSDFLRKAIATQFHGKEYMIANETSIDKPTPYSMKPRKLKAFLIQESNGASHSIYFDVTEVSLANTINWLGH